MGERILFFFLLVVAVRSQPAQPNDAIADSRRPSVYIERAESTSAAEDQHGVLLALHNNTKWAIRIRTESLYIGDKVKPVTLRNGKGVLAIRPSTIISPCYVVEGTQNVSRDTVNEQPYQRLPLGSACTVGSTSWIPSGGNVLMRIPDDHLAAGRRISIDFEYEWEETPNVEHRVLFTQVQGTRLRP
jgi:hypothetical protein